MAIIAIPQLDKELQNKTLSIIELTPRVRDALAIIQEAQAKGKNLENKLIAYKTARLAICNQHGVKDEKGRLRIKNHHYLVDEKAAAELATLKIEHAELFTAKEEFKNPTELAVLLSNSEHTVFDRNETEGVYYVFIEPEGLEAVNLAKVISK